MKRRQAVAAAADPVKLDDVIEQVSEPMVLAPGHPLRSQRCLLCGTLIGGQACRLAQLVDLRGGGCSCGAIDSISMLICGDHGDGAAVDWMTLLTGRWMTHHCVVTA